MADQQAEHTFDKLLDSKSKSRVKSLCFNVKIQQQGNTLFCNISGFQTITGQRKYRGVL